LPLYFYYLSLHDALPISDALPIAPCPRRLFDCISCRIPNILGFLTICNNLISYTYSSDHGKSEKNFFHVHSFVGVVGVPRLELGTSSLSAMRSNRLSYTPSFRFCH